MKAIYLCLFFCSLGFVQLIADQVVEEKKAPFFEDEISSLHRLIQVNEKRLTTQKEIKEMMELLQKQKDAFVLGNQSKSHTFSMVSNARKILVSVKSENLSYLFDTEYLEELLFFSSLATKSVPMKP